MSNERKLVESSTEEARDSAHNLVEMGSSKDSLQGYVAINNVDEDQEIARVAYQFYQERGGEHGMHHEDWLRAEREVRLRREALST